MFFIYLLDQVWINVIAAVSVMVFVYLVVIILSFFFMGSFHKKLKNSKETIDVLIYQKAQIINKLIDLIIDKSKWDEKIKNFKNNLDLQGFTVVDKEKITSYWSFLSELYKVVVLSFSDNVNQEKDERTIKNLLMGLGEIDSKYNEQFQLYNTYVEGFNYWNNFFSTRWIKRVFRIKNRETLK